MLLLGAGASVNAARESGATPLFSAVQQNSSPDLIKVLLDAGANVDAETSVSFA